MWHGPDRRYRGLCICACRVIVLFVLCVCVNSLVFLRALLCLYVTKNFLFGSTHLPNPLINPF